MTISSIMSSVTKVAVLFTITSLLLMTSQESAQTRAACKSNGGPCLFGNDCCSKYCRLKDNWGSNADRLRNINTPGECYTPCKESGGQCDNNIDCCPGRRCNLPVHKCVKCRHEKERCETDSDCCTNNCISAEEPSIFSNMTFCDRTPCVTYPRACLHSADCCSLKCDFPENSSSRFGRCARY